MAGYEEKETAFYKKIEELLQAQPIVFLEYYIDLKENGKSYKTIDKYLSNLLIVLNEIEPRLFSEKGDVLFDEIQIEDIENYFKVHNELGAGILKLRWSILNSFFIFLKKRGYVKDNVVQETNRPYEKVVSRKIDYLTRDELRDLIEAVRKNKRKFNSYRDEIIIKLALSTGLDVSEITNLNVDQVDIEKGHICIERRGMQRTIKIGSVMSKILEIWIKYQKGYLGDVKTDALFISAKKHRMSVDAMEQMLAKYCLDAQIKLVSMKDLKYTMIYLLAKQGVSMKAIMQFCGTENWLMIAQVYDEAIAENHVSIEKQLDALIDYSVNE